MVKQKDATWSDVKAGLAQFDRAGLLGLVKDLYSLRPENRAFVAARLHIGSDPLMPFKMVISRWTFPDLTKGQEVSVSKAKKAIADYRKAIGQPEGMAELSTFYCEEAARMVRNFGLEDEAYYSALVRMYGQALSQAATLQPDVGDNMLRRLDAVRGSLCGIGWGVSDAVNEIWHDRIG